MNNFEIEKRTNSINIDIMNKLTLDAEGKVLINGQKAILKSELSENILDDASSSNTTTYSSNILDTTFVKTNNANFTDLTDNGDTSLHYHTTDRNRENHTGTQTASTISDFQTEVSNNTNVKANTDARHSHANKSSLDKLTTISDWEVYTPIISAITTNPTMPTSYEIQGLYKIVGKTLYIKFSFHNINGTGSAGSGTYKFSIPNGYAIDTSVASIPTNTICSAGNFAGINGTPLGMGVIGHSSVVAPVFVVPLDDTNVGLFDTTVNGTARNTLIGSSVGAMNASVHMFYVFSAEIPITN